MNSNIEIKARVRDFHQLQELAGQLSDTPEELIRQEDIFFQVPKGRLKLRIFSPAEGELIYYQRNDQKGPKQSNYSITKTADPAGLKSSLAEALGILGVVRKERHLYLAGQTRIHLDEVEDLGHFLELEVVMPPDQTVEEATQIAHGLMEKLAIRDKDLIDRAYIDLLIEKG